MAKNLNVLRRIEYMNIKFSFPILIILGEFFSYDKRAAIRSPFFADQWLQQQQNTITIARIMIQVQLSSKMWQRQLLFICSSKVVIERCAHYILCNLVGIGEIKYGVALLQDKASLKIFAVLRNKAGHGFGCALGQESSNLGDGNISFTDIDTYAE
jgi:hypothetical protein